MKTINNSNPLRAGFYASIACASIILLYPVCFIAILLSSPLFIWSTPDEYLTYYQSGNRFFQDFAMTLMLFFGPLWVLMLGSIQENTEKGAEYWPRLSLLFGSAFMILSSANYFLQLTTVRFNIADGSIGSIIHFIQANPHSAITGLNMLGWTLFLGFSSLFAAPAFSGGKLERILRYAFIVNGVVCLSGGISYILDYPILVFITMYPGMGGTFTVITVSLAIHFKRKENTSVKHLDTNEKNYYFT